MHRRRRGKESAEDATLRLVQEHAAELLRFARRFSHCADDAHDAYQRTIEIFLRRVDSDPPAHPLSWVRTVLRNEALALRAERDRLVGHSEVDFDQHEDGRFEDPAEHVVGHERLRQTAEALRRLKPQEVTALVLRAEGLSYREICSRTGWTYTRANRTITEGRRALLKRLDAIESGAECERWLPVLSALADGEATATQLAELRPHLRACPACRATLRDCRELPSQVAALVPPALATVAAGSQPSLTDHAGVVLHALAERATLLLVRAQSALEAAPGAKLAAVAASTAALAGGGVAIEQAAHAAGARPRPAVASAGARSPGAARLTPIVFPSRTSLAARAQSNGTPRGEFAATTQGTPEFASRSSPSAEFAASASAGAGPSPHASAATARSPDPAASPVSVPPQVAARRSGSPSEFAGP